MLFYIACFTNLVFLVIVIFSFNYECKFCYVWTLLCFLYFSVSF